MVKLPKQKSFLFEILLELDLGFSSFPHNKKESAEDRQGQGIGDWYWD